MQRTPSNSTERQTRVQVAHIALSFELGGAEKLLVEFAKHGDRQRFDLHFLALASDGVIGDQLRATGCTATALHASDGLRPTLVCRLAKLLRRKGIEIVHTHLDRPHIYGTLAARLAGIDCVIHTRHGQASNLSARQHQLVRGIARWTKQFVCVSDDAARLTAQTHGISANRVSTIRNGIDLTQFSERSHDGDGPVVNVARLAPEKDLETWIRAAALAAGIDRNVRFEIAGDGPCREKLQALVRELGLADRLRFVGTIDDVASFLSRAGMFVLSSQTEGISLAVLEAQALGVPVIATAVGGNTEVIDDGENGLLVPVGNPRAIADSILRLRRDRALASQLGQRGRERMRERFDATVMVDHYQSLYESLLNVEQLMVPS